MKQVCQLLPGISICNANGQRAAKLNQMSLGHAKGKKIVNRLRHSYLNVMKLENCGPTVECLKNNH
jgi:hypothetical protein